MPVLGFVYAMTSIPLKKRFLMGIEQIVLITIDNFRGI